MGNTFKTAFLLTALTLAIDVSLAGLSADKTAC